MKKHKGNPNWGRVRILPERFEWEPSDWEKLLKRYGIRDDSHAIEILAAKSKRSLAIRQWVGAMMMRRYVPTLVLNALELRISVDSRFPEA